MIRIALVLLLSFTWLSALASTGVIAIMAMVGPGKPPDPNGPERFLGWPNRLFMIAYVVWLIVVAWPLP